MSFAKSHTLASFDDTVTSIISKSGVTCSQERLLDGKKVPIELPKEIPKVVVMGKTIKYY